MPTNLRKITNVNSFTYSSNITGIFEDGVITTVKQPTPIRTVLKVGGISGGSSVSIGNLGTLEFDLFADTAAGNVNAGGLTFIDGVPLASCPDSSKTFFKYWNGTKTWLEIEAGITYRTQVNATTAFSSYLIWEAEYSASGTFEDFNNIWGHGIGYMYEDAGGASGTTYGSDQPRAHLYMPTDRWFPDNGYKYRWRHAVGTTAAAVLIYPGYYIKVTEWAGMNTYQDL